MPDAQQETAQFHDFLRVFLHEHTAFLKKILRVYVLRMGLASGENVSVMVDEIFQDTILQIMTHSERFMHVQEPRLVPRGCGQSLEAPPGQADQTRTL